MLDCLSLFQRILLIRNNSPFSVRRTVRIVMFVFITIAVLGATRIRAQNSDQKSAPVVVQPGAPGQSSRILPSSSRARLPLHSAKDVEFMQGMIMHHAQAVEMTALIESKTANKYIRLIGERISKSQTDEMQFMKQWLETRGKTASIPMAAGHDHGADHHKLMPGMLSPKQMDALAAAKGAEFDRLFLTGMIQHHEGALIMVKDLFDSPGTGQDAELFSFASDVDSGQRAEIRSMQNLLSGKNVKE